MDTQALPPERRARYPGKGANGWWFFLLDRASRRSLRDLLQEYVDQTSADVDEDVADEDEEDEEEEP